MSLSILALLFAPSAQAAPQCYEVVGTVVSSDMGPSGPDIVAGLGVTATVEYDTDDALLGSVFPQTDIWYLPFPGSRMDFLFSNGEYVGWDASPALVRMFVSRPWVGGTTLSYVGALSGQLQGRVIFTGPQLFVEPAGVAPVDPELHLFDTLVGEVADLASGAKATIDFTAVWPCGTRVAPPPPQASPDDAFRELRGAISTMRGDEHILYDAIDLSEAALREARASVSAGDVSAAQVTYCESIAFAGEVGVLVDIFAPRRMAQHKADITIARAQDVVASLQHERSSSQVPACPLQTP